MNKIWKNIYIYKLYQIYDDIIIIIIIIKNHYKQFTIYLFESIRVIFFN